MLILLRQPPDGRIQELIHSAHQESPSIHLVYLEQSLTNISTPPLVLNGLTYSMDPSLEPGIQTIDGKVLLELIRQESRILILP